MAVKAACWHLVSCHKHFKNLSTKFIDNNVYSTGWERPLLGSLFYVAYYFIYYSQTTFPPLPSRGNSLFALLAFSYHWLRFVRWEYKSGARWWQNLWNKNEHSVMSNCFFLTRKRYDFIHVSSWCTFSACAHAYIKSSGESCCGQWIRYLCLHNILKFMDLSLDGTTCWDL